MGSSSKSGGGFDKLRKRLEDLSKLQGKIGWPLDAVNKDGAKLADVAIAQELGSAKGTPPRPFMRAAMSENGNQWLQRLSNDAKACLNSQISAHSVLEKTAQSAKSDIAQSLKSMTTSHKAKADDAKDDDTSLLLKTLTVQVKKKL